MKQDESDWDNQWGRAQDTAAVVMAAGIASFAGFIVGLACWLLFKNAAVGAFIGIGVFVATCSIVLRDWHE